MTCKETAKQCLADATWPPPNRLPMQIYYRGVPIEEFDKEDLIKIVALCLEQLKCMETRELARLKNCFETT